MSPESTQRGNRNATVKGNCFANGLVDCRCSSSSAPHKPSFTTARAGKGRLLCASAITSTKLSTPDHIHPSTEHFEYRYFAIRRWHVRALLVYGEMAFTARRDLLTAVEISGKRGDSEKCTEEKRDDTIQCLQSTLPASMQVYDCHPSSATHESWKAMGRLPIGRAERVLNSTSTTRSSRRKIVSIIILVHAAPSRALFPRALCASSESLPSSPSLLPAC